MKKSAFMIALLSSTTLISANCIAANTIIDETAYDDYIISDIYSKKNIYNITTNISNSTFEQNLFGNLSKNITNSTINIDDSSTTVYGNVVGLVRGEGGTIGDTNEINISDGYIYGAVAATADIVDSYTEDNATDRRTANIINFTGGTIQTAIVGGAGAETNEINISGGILGNGTTSGTIYTGTVNETLVNRSTNAIVTLKDMDDDNEFLSSFVEGVDNSGMIIASNLAEGGNATLNFNNIDGTYKGGFSGFNDVNIKKSSNVVLGGTTYSTDNLTVLGSLDPNGKTINSANTNLLNVIVGSDSNKTAEISSSILTDDNLEITNYGTIDGVVAGGTLYIENNNKMIGTLDNSTVRPDTTLIEAANIEIVNYGTIKNNYYYKTTTDDGTIDISNYGTINDLQYIQTGTLTNEIGGIIEDARIWTDEEVEIINYGDIEGDNSFRASQGSTLNFINYGTIESDINWDHNDYDTYEDYDDYINEGSEFAIGTYVVNDETTATFYNAEGGYVYGSVTTFGNVTSFVNDGTMYAANIKHLSGSSTDLTVENNGSIFFLGDFSATQSGNDYSGGTYDDYNHATLINNGTIYGFVKMQYSNIINEENGFISSLEITSMANDTTHGGDNYLTNKGVIGYEESKYTYYEDHGYLTFIQEDPNATMTFINEETGIVYASLQFLNHIETIENYGTFYNNKYIIASEANITIDNYGSMIGMHENTMTADPWTVNNKETGIMEGSFTAPWLSINNEGTIQNMTFNSFGENYYICDSYYDEPIIDYEQSVIYNTGKITGTNSFLIQDNTSIIFTNDGLMEGTNTFAYVDNLEDGYITFSNEDNGIITGNLNFAVLPTGGIKSEGTLTDLTITATSDTAETLDLQNDGLIEVALTLTDIDTDIVNNGKIGRYSDTTITTNSTVNIENNGLIKNTTLTSIDDGVFTLENTEDGIIKEKLIVDTGLEKIDSTGMFINLELTTATDDFTINNQGIVVGGITLSEESQGFVFNNSDEAIIYGDFNHYGQDIVINHSADEDFESDIYNNSSEDSGTLALNNIGESSKINSAISGTYEELNITNSNTNIDEATVNISLNEVVSNSINIDNSGYTKLALNKDSNTSIIETSADVSTDECLTNIIEIDNNASFTGQIDIQNSKLVLDNSSSIDTESIVTRELELTNSGEINSTFEISASLDVTNTGTITGAENAFILSPETLGIINNTGTISSTGTTIAIDDSINECESCEYEDLIINNIGGSVLALDLNNLSASSLNNYAINASTAIVENTSGGTISGSIIAESYYQSADSIWISYLDSSTTSMNTITVADKIIVDSGASLNIVTNNDVTDFEDGDKYLIVSGSENQTDIEDNVNNFSITADTPFATYDVEMDGSDAYLVFSSVDPTTFATSTDIAASNHGRIVTSSHRVYEMFVNKDAAQVVNLSSGDNQNYDNSINFMPLLGYASQDSNSGGAGYESDYYGGIGYFEHDFNIGIKGGIGLAYLYTDTDHKDDLGSDGTMNTYRPFVYVNFEEGKFKADLAAGFAYHDIKDNRSYSDSGTNYVANSDYNSKEYSAHLNLGYKIWDENGEIIQPIAGYYVAKVKTDSYEETGSGPMNMNVSAEDYDSHKSMLGVKMSKEFELESGTTFTPEVHLRWYHEFGDTSGSVTSYFLAQEQLFTSSGVDSPKDIGDVAIRLTSNSGAKWDSFIETYYQFGSGFYNIGASIGAQYNF